MQINSESADQEIAAHQQSHGSNVPLHVLSNMLFAGI